MLQEVIKSYVVVQFLRLYQFWYLFRSILSIYWDKFDIYILKWEINTQFCVIEVLPNLVKRFTNVFVSQFAFPHFSIACIVFLRKFNSCHCAEFIVQHSDCDISWLPELIVPSSNKLIQRTAAFSRIHVNLIEFSINTSLIKSTMQCTAELQNWASDFEHSIMKAATLNFINDYCDLLKLV